MSNEWSKPAAPPPPLFLGKKERDLVKQVNDELIERVIGQQIVYYPIDLETTNYHSLYGEAIEKTFLAPVRVYALVEWEGMETQYSPNIGMGVVENIRIILPTLQEQKQILKYLDDQTQKIDTTIEKETQRIDLLQEYRQSLISNVVTGKVDVRDEVLV